MSRNSPSTRRHRALKFLGHLWQYKTYGPLIGPKEAHQPDYRWAAKSAGEKHAAGGVLVWHLMEVP